MTHRIRIEKAFVWLSVLFVFALGMLLGILLDFLESANNFEAARRSLEDTASRLIEW